jgi:putative ABC transport system ATP-binding protein
MSRNIEIRDLMKVYMKGDNEIRALDHIDLDVTAGEFVALMGPSGSGKTTLLNIIAGIDYPTSGKVYVDENEITGLSESQRTKWRTRHIGYIFQFYNLLPVLTAYENVELPLLLLPMSRKDRHNHVSAALEAVGIADRAKHFPRELSGGQEQRVAIARAIVTDAHVLVADEPTGNLDAESEQEIMSLLKRLNKELTKTILMVTHDESAAKFADRTVKLAKGKLL